MNGNNSGTQTDQPTNQPLRKFQQEQPSKDLFPAFGIYTE